MLLLERITQRIGFVRCGDRFYSFLLEELRCLNREVASFLGITSAYYDANNGTVNRPEIGKSVHHPSRRITSIAGDDGSEDRSTFECRGQKDLDGGVIENATECVVVFRLAKLRFVLPVHRLESDRYCRVGLGIESLLLESSLTLSESIRETLHHVLYFSPLLLFSSIE